VRPLDFFFLFTVLALMLLMLWIGKWRDDVLSERIDALQEIHAPTEND